VNLNPWLSNIKYYGDAQKDELNLHAILNPSRDKRDQLHALAAVLSKKAPCIMDLTARVLSLVGVPKGKIPALRLEKYNPSATLLSHCNDYCHNSAFRKKVCLKYGVKTRRISIRTYFVVSLQLMINANNIKTRGSWVACGPAVLFIRSSHWSDIPIIVRGVAQCRSCSNLSRTCFFHHELEGSKRSATARWQRTTNISNVRIREV